MKKHVKVSLLIVASLTIISAITSIVMLNAVFGDALLHMNSRLGAFYAVTYRWFTLASVILVLFWIILAVKNRSLFFAKAARFRSNDKKDVKHAQVDDAVVSEKEEPKEKQGSFCPHCGQRRLSEKPFCPFCGKAV